MVLISIAFLPLTNVEDNHINAAAYWNLCICFEEEAEDPSDHQSWDNTSRVSTTPTDYSGTLQLSRGSWVRTETWDWILLMSKLATIKVEQNATQVNRSCPCSENTLICCVLFEIICVCVSPELLPQFVSKDDKGLPTSS